MKQCHCNERQLFPLFYEEIVTGVRDDKPLLESGEGHGPRKEFFNLVGEELIQQCKGEANCPLQSVPIQ